MNFCKIICTFATALSIGISVFCRPVFALEAFSENSIGNLYSAASDKYLYTSSDGFIYTSYNGQVTVRDHKNKNITNLSIPSTIDGMPVTTVTGFNEYSSLKLVTIPNSVKDISGFKDCPNLTLVDFPSTELLVSSTVCRGTPFINDQKTVIKYGGSLSLLSGKMTKTIAISCDENATSAVFEDGTLYIANYIFNQNDKIKSIIVPGSVKKIPLGFAANCDNLTSVILSEGTTKIDLSFINCKNLKNITIPASVTEIEESDLGPTLGYYLSYDDLKDVKIPGFTITGYTGTAAETYAKKHGFRFIALGETAKGDVNMDGLVDVNDASLVLSYYAQKSVGLDPDANTVFANIKFGDIDENGSIQIDDATKILSYYAQKAVGLNPSWD